MKSSVRSFLWHDLDTNTILQNWTWILGDIAILGEIVVCEIEDYNICIKMTLSRRRLYNTSVTGVLIGKHS